MLRNFFLLAFAIVIFKSIPAFAQDDSLLTYTEKMGLQFLEDTLSDVDIYLYGVTSVIADDETEKILPGVAITMRDLFSETIHVKTDDSAFYHLELKFDNIYTIYYEYEGMYTKFIEIDTRDVVDIEQERGYLFPTNIAMQPSKSFEVAALYLKKPVGKAYFDWRLQMLVWDLKYTDRINAERIKVQRRVPGGKKK